MESGESSVLPHAPSQLRKQAPVRRRRSAHRHTAVRRLRLGWRGKLVLAILAFVLMSVAWAVLMRASAPAGNTALDRFDAIVVLGSPANREGNPTPAELALVTEGVHEYERGVAPRLIFTGGAAHNHFVEARVMARVAEAQGVPASAVILEPEAKDTIQNACYSERIMKAHDWRSAEVVSVAEHLPRTGLILSRLPIEWRTHVAPLIAPQPDIVLQARTAMEILKTMRYLLYAQWAESCSP